jgi:O-antigen/teichoic acid export membrane protein
MNQPTHDTRMPDIRRAFLWASLGRYVVMAINLAATLILARLLTPADYGVSVLGGAVLAVAEAIRGLGGGTYLVQRADLTPESIRSSFTVNLIVTALVAAMLVLLSGPLARAFGTPGMAPYLLISLLGYLAGPVVYPISALLSRRMAFGRLALAGVVTALVNAAVGAALALRGFGAMSFAWAGAVSTLASVPLYLACRPDRSIFRPTLRAWRSVIAFGLFDSATAILSQIGEALPYLMLGRILSPQAVGLGQRAVLLCLFPERVILAGVGAVALPAFAQQVRQGGSLKQEYLRAITLITVAQWPALLLMIVLAQPLVAVLLGAQWHDVVPLVQILSVALLFSFPVSLHYPTLVAVGAIRFMPPVVVTQAVVSLTALAVAAQHGLRAAALSMLLVVPFNGLLSLLLVRHFVRFRWREFAAATAKSAVCAACSIVGPACLVGATSTLSLAAASGAIIVAAAGWAGGLVATRHPMLDEIRRFGRKKGFLF